ncbi:MAG: hypothetical protein KDG50_05315 [Chromatiales bacterium]|nr:hypothetical protein [Chromatiales bacterium]
MTTCSDVATADLDSDLDAYSRRAARSGGRKSPAELLGYTAAATGMAFAGGDAMASVMHMTTPQTFSVGSNSLKNFLFDVDGAGAPDFFFVLGHAFYTGGGTSYGSAFAELGFAAPGRALKGPTFLADLVAGALIGPTGSFGSGPFYSVSTYSGVTSSVRGSFSPSSTGLLGFRFTGATGVPGTQYGWAQIHVAARPGPGGSASLTISEWAFENCGDSIQAGQTSGVGSCDAVSTPAPSPATPLLALLGLGAMGIRRYRERREVGLKRLAESAAPA